MLHSPLFRRLFGTVAFLALLPLVATAVGAALLIGEESRRAAEERLRSHALLGREAALPHFRAGDGPALDGLARRLGRELDVRFTFLSGDGRVLGDSDAPAAVEDHAARPEVREARERGVGVARRHDYALDREMIYVAVRADPDDPRGGTVRAALAASAFEGRLHALYGRIALAATPFGLAALALAALWLRAFARAVVDLTASAQAVAEGAPAARVDAEERQDEVGTLARTVRSMAEELEHRLRAVESERNRLATVVGGLGEGLVAVDADARILLFNRAAARILGVERSVAPGRPLVDVVPHGEVVAVVREALETARFGPPPAAANGVSGPPTPSPLADSRSGRIRLGRLERRVEVFSAKGGEPRAVEARATAFGEEPGHPEGVVLLLRDVTELERYERLRRDFVANVSHELRTPLALIKGFLETLEDGALRDPEKGPRFLEILARHVRGLERLVDDLLTLSALEAGAESAPPEDVPVAEAVESVLAAFEPVFERRRLTVARRLPGGLPALRACRDHVERAVRNLVDNAVKFTPEGGSIAVEAAAAAGRVAIIVRDDGPGIPPEDQARIFERFYRVEKSRSREAGGTGLGLAIVKHIVQQAGGSVSVESELGRGATFTLTFPGAGAGAGAGG